MSDAYDPRQQPDKKPGILSRAGNSPSFAGLTRYGVLLIGAAISWAAYDAHDVIQSVKDDQVAISKLAEKTKGVEDATGTLKSTLEEYRHWAGTSIDNLVAGQNLQAKSLYELQVGATRTGNRLQCLEVNRPCPQVQ